MNKESDAPGYFKLQTKLAPTELQSDGPSTIFDMSWGAAFVEVMTDASSTVSTLRDNILETSAETTADPTDSCSTMSTETSDTSGAAPPDSVAVKATVTTVAAESTGTIRKLEH